MAGGVKAGGDVAVVGAGIVGLATAYSLHKRGARVRVFDPLPGSGQSAGSTRIFRHQHKDERLVRLAVRSRRLWDEWGEELDARLLREGGALLASGQDDLHALEDRLTKLGVDYELLDRAAQEELFPQLCPPSEHALLDPGGGSIQAAETIAALREALGSCLQGEAAIGMYEASGGGAALVMPTGVSEFSAAIICAGAGTEVLARAAGVEIPLHYEWHLRASFAPVDVGTLPGVCWQDRTAAYGESVYGTPGIAEREYAIGLVGDDVNLPSAPGEPIGDRDWIPATRARIVSYVRQAMPAFADLPVSMRLCPSTALAGDPDDFRIWSGGPFYFIAGNNLFKMAPVIGEELAAAAASRQVPADLQPAH